jgi:hypothetical protein
MEKITISADTMEPLATIGTLAQGSPDTSNNGPLADVLSSATAAAARRSDESGEVEVSAIHLSTLVGYSRDGITEAENAGRTDDLQRFSEASAKARRRLRETGVWE